MLLVVVVALREDEDRVVQLPPRLMSKKRVLTISIMENFQVITHAGGRFMCYQAMPMHTKPTLENLG